MFACRNCGSFFSEPKRYREKHGFDDEPSEEFDGCPYCAGDYVDALICSICGDIISGKYIELEDHNVCGMCYALKDTEY